MNSNLVKAHLALFLVNALYGANHVIAKGIMPQYLSPNVFIFLRVLGATLLFWILRLFFIREKVDRKDLWRLAVCGVFGVAVNQLFFFNGLNLSSSINSGIIMTLNPIIVVILSFFILREPITSMRSVGILIGTVGAILLTVSSGSLSGEASLGDLFLFINATSYALYLVLVKPLMAKYRPITVITFVFTFGLIYVTAFPLTIPELLETDFSRFPIDVVWKIIYVIIGVTFFTYLLTVYGLRLVSPSVTSAYIYLQPVLVIIFAYLLFYLGVAEDYRGTITLEKVLYMLIIFTGVYITSSTSFVRKRM